MSGIEAARHIRDVDPDVILIFVSSSNDFYRESYDLYAFNYVIKPPAADKFAEVLRKAIKHLSGDAEQVVRFSFNNNLRTVRCSQILYLMSEQHVMNFHLTNEEILKSYIKMEDCITQFPAQTFVRCHQSYVVNLKYVTGMTANEFLLDELRVPVSRNYSAQAREKYRARMFCDF